jgi:hypothetical protein
LFRLTMRGVLRSASKALRRERRRFQPCWSTAELSQKPRESAPLLAVTL